MRCDRSVFQKDFFYLFKSVGVSVKIIKQGPKWEKKDQKLNDF